MIRRLIGEVPSGQRLALEHDTHHGPAMRELLRDATTLTRLHGWRAGDRRPRPMSEAPPRAEPPAGSTEAERRAKAERLRAEGIDPFPRSFPDRTKIAEILAAHDPAELGEGEHAEFSYRIAGRLTGQRGHGKTTFFDVRDLSGTIQAYARLDALGQEAYDRIEDLDIGDIVGVEGDLYVTKRGQLALSVRECIAARQGAARPARPLPRHLRRRDPLPAAGARPDGERALARGVRAAGEGAGGDPRPHERARLRRAGNADPAAAHRRRRGASLQNAPPRARPPPLPPHRDRALPEARHRRRLRGRLRARQVLPQRGDVAAAQPRVHDARVVRQRRRLQRRDGVRRGARRRRGRAGPRHDEGRARRRDDRLRDPLEAGHRARRDQGGDRRRHRRVQPRRAGRAGRGRRRARRRLGRAGRHAAGQAGRAEADPAHLHRRPAARHLAAGQGRTPSTRS